jgi:hypothetical protein
MKFRTVSGDGSRLDALSAFFRFILYFQTYIEFRWPVNSECRFAGSHVHGNADALLERVSRSENVITIEQKYDPEDAAEALSTPRTSPLA